MSPPPDMCCAAAVSARNGRVIRAPANAATPTAASSTAAAAPMTCQPLPDNEIAAVGVPVGFVRYSRTGGATYGVSCSLRDAVTQAATAGSSGGATPVVCLPAGV